MIFPVINFQFSDVKVGMSISKCGISPEDFYGGKNSRQEKIEAIIKLNHNSNKDRLPKFMTRLLGPSKTWKIFKKQQDAVDFCLLKRNGLMPFAFEDVNGRRMFLAAHPKVFWALNHHRFFKSCSTYEIIRENSACKLYLDIEFEYAYNRNRNGEKILNNLLHVINFYLKKLFNITCTGKEVLDLDSTSDTKFSHHVIYETENIAFQDNYAVGNFIRKITGELRSAFESNNSGDSTKLQELSSAYCIPPNDILEFFVSDRKNQTKLFIDEGVYTKNRHFRLLGSSKKDKNIPLKISEKNEYKPSGGDDPLNYFLDSLVTYFSWEVQRVLECAESGPQKLHRIQRQVRRQTQKEELPIHQQIDSFINSLILPSGSIRRKVFFSNSSTIVYDIQGFRYCQNIQREHKSNNIKYIVDLENLVFYQKCYDPDCMDFRSAMNHLPEEICFLFEDDSLFLTGSEDILEDFDKVLRGAENENQSFNQCISDEDLGHIADCAETLLGITW